MRTKAAKARIRARIASASAAPSEAKPGRMSTSCSRMNTIATAATASENQATLRDHRAARVTGSSMIRRRIARRSSCGREVARYQAGAAASRAGQAIVAEHVAQDRLLDLAGRGVGDFRDHDHVVRKPPFGDPALHEGEEVLPGRLTAGLRHHDEERALVPFRVLDA